MSAAHLIEHGWRRTTSGRYVHPDLAPLDNGRRRVFTEAEALTLTDATVDACCEHCGTTACARAEAEVPAS